MDPEAVVLGTQAVAALQAMAHPAPTWTDIAGIGVGLIQALLIWVGLHRMGQAAEDRKNQHEETMSHMEAAAEDRKNQHEEAMQALQDQREQARQQHEENMKKLDVMGAQQESQASSLEEVKETVVRAIANSTVH